MLPLRLAAALLLCGSLASAMPAGYSCDASKTVCASNSPPGGLKPAETPQFILISHDDHITVTTNNAVRGVLNQFKNPGGCNVPATFFVSGGAGTNCAIARRLQADNHELASHTFSHTSLTPGGAVDITDQIGRQRAWLNDTCGIPLESMHGFRAPYLLHNPESRAALQALGFKYDSSIIESWPSATSPSSANRLWGGYSWSAGTPQDCRWMAPSTCNSSERYSDLWEFPLQQFLTGPVQNGRAVALSSMDPTAESEEALLAQLLEQFGYSYSGNRAPVGIYLHTPWRAAARGQPFAVKPFHAPALAAFIKAVQAKPDVWFVTFIQLQQWMQAPVAASRMASWLKCNKVDFAAQERAPCTTYTVKAGDTVYSILAAQELELAALVAVNPALQNSSAALYIGQRLRLPPYPASCPADVLSALPPCRNHTAVSGDSLYGIAEKYDITVQDLLSVNAGLTTTSTLRLGQARRGRGGGRVLKVPPQPVECIYGNWTVVVPSPAPAAPSPAPAPVSDSCGAEVVELDLQLTGFDAASWDAHQAAFVAGLAALVRESAACIAITRTGVGATAAGQRRLLGVGQRSLLADPQLLVLATIHTPNATRVWGYLQGAQQLGTLPLMLSTLGAASLDSVTYSALDSQGRPIATSPAASPSPVPASPVPASPSPAQPSPATPASPSPAPAVLDATPVPTASKGKNKHLGAIIGGAVGGGVGALLALAAIVFFMRRGQGGTGGAGKPGLRATFNPAYGMGTTAGAVATLSAPTSKQAFELTEVVERTGTPTSARQRHPTAFS